MKGNIKDYLEQTNTVLLTKDAFEYLKEKACAIDKARVEICQLHSYVAKFAGGSFAIHIDKEKVLQIIDKYQAGSEPQESKDDTWSLKDVADALKRHGFLQEQESCDDCIRRQAVMDAMYDICGEGSLKDDPWRDNPHIDSIIDAIEDLPSVTPKQKMGRWIYTGDYITDGMLKCSKCGFEHDVSERFSYCPNCGAKMESEDTE